MSNSNNGVRDTISKEKLKDAVVTESIKKGVLSKGEYERLLEQRKFESTNEGSYSWKLMLENDSVRKLLEKHYINVNNMLKSIKNSVAKSKRHEKELKTGTITSELRPGFPMTKWEVESEKYAAEQIAYADSRDIPMELGKIRQNIVGIKDLFGKVIIDEKEFDDYVKKIEKELKKSGFKLFTR